MKGQLYDPDGAGPLDAEVARVRQAQADYALRRPPLVPDALGSGGGGGIGAGTGAAIGSIVPGIGTAIGAAVGGLIGSIFGGGPDTPTQQQIFISSLRSFAPDQNAPLAGIPLDLSALNGNSPLWLTLPLDDPYWANVSRSTIEWWIKNYGLGVFLAGVKDFLSNTPTGRPLPGSVASPTGGIEASLGGLTDTLGGVVGAITAGIAAATNSANAGVAATTSAITSTLNQWTSQMGNFQNSLGDFITKGIGGLLESLFNPSGGVVGAIEGAIRGLEQEQTTVFGSILATIGRDVEKVEQGLLGLPISLTDILRQALKQLPQILIDVFGSELGPLKEIVHVIEIIAGKLPGKSDSGLTVDHLAEILARVMDAAESIAGTTGVPANVVYRKLDKLETSCDREGMLKKLDDWVASFGKLPCFVQDGISGIGVAFAEIAKLVPWFLQNTELAEEVQNQNCPLVKLPPSTAVQGWLRGFISDEVLDEELTKQGMSKSRIQTLKDLTSHYYTAGEALDMWWRGIVDDDQLSTLLAENGYNDQQKEAAKTASFRITDVSTAILAYNRGLISDDAFGTILTANHFDSVQVDLFRLLRKRPPNPAEALKGQLTRDAIGTFGIPRITDFDTVPEWFTTAATKDGLDADTTQRLWWSHFDFGGLGNWISAYYRGLRLYPELVGVAKGLGVPEEVLGDLVDIGRPLIPFRTIPAMVTAGIIDDDKARQLIRKHGFSKDDTDILIRYAHRGNKSSKATTASTQHETSLANAKLAYEDGLITQDQYMELLKAHGLDDDAATLEIQLANIGQETKARKQISTDIINEYQAGLINQTTATQQLATSGLTIAEQAKALKTINSARSAKGKIPSEAELRAFAKADIITADEYESELQTSGFSKKVAGWFRDLHFPQA